MSRVWARRHRAGHANVAADPVPWTKPEDIDGDDAQPIEGTVDNRFKIYNLLLDDGSVRSQRPGINPAVWKALLTAEGSEIVPID